MEPPFGQKSCLTHLCSPEPCAGRLKSLLTNVWPLGSQDQLGQSDRRWGQVTQQQGSLCSVPPAELHPATGRTLSGQVPSSQWPQVPSNPEPLSPDQPRVHLSLQTATSYKSLTDRVLSHHQQHHATRASPGFTPGQAPSLHSKGSPQRSHHLPQEPCRRFSY